MSAAGLYAVFERYQLREKIDGCPHCVDGADSDRLHSRSLRALTWEDFGVYPFKAVTTFGTVDDFKHFLPRLLELFLSAGEGPYDAFLIFEKLKYAEFERWPNEERSAVTDFIFGAMSTLADKSTSDAEDTWDSAYVFLKHIGAI